MELNLEADYDGSLAATQAAIASSSADGGCSTGVNNSCLASIQVYLLAKTLERGDMPSIYSTLSLFKKVVDV